MDDLNVSSALAVAGMKAQARRLRVISENMANADSVATTRGGAPYRRQVITFRQEYDKALKAKAVDAGRVAKDPSEFGRKYDPHHPAADEAGYVLTPNVNMLVEIMDMREAERGYEANMAVMNVSRDLVGSTLGLLSN